MNTMINKYTYSYFALLFHRLFSVTDWQQRWRSHINVVQKAGWSSDQMHGTITKINDEQKLISTNNPRTQSKEPAVIEKY